MATTTTGSAVLLAVVATMATVFLHSNPAGAAGAFAGTLRSNNTEFIRRSCASTLYPSLCYTSLAGYADDVARDPSRLARVATNVSLARVYSDSSHVASLRRSDAARKLDARTASGLRDCEETLGSATDLTRKSTAELGLLPTASTATEVAWLVSNVQTWMSAALTNEGTCVDGFDGTPSSAVKVDVLQRVRGTEQYTSNALALVNRLVGTRR